MAKLVLDDIGSTLTNTAASTINNNNNKIEQALENTLSRDGSTPNQMNADIDLNSNDLLNVGVANIESLILNGQAVSPADAVVLPPAVMLKTTYDPQGKNSDAFDRANHTGTQSVTTITEGDNGIRNFIDPFKNFSANGVTDDTANFTTLRSLYPNVDFDLRGATYRVTSIPEGPFHNGYWVIVGAGEGGGTIRFPAPNTLKADTRKIAWGDRLSNWPQDKACRYNDILYTAWMEGDDHVAADVHIRIARSFDNGNTWTRIERLFQSATGARGSFSMGVCHGRLVIIVREHTGGFSDGTITTNRLFSRRCGERREKKISPFTGIDATNMQIVATNASATYRVANVSKHGCFVGDVIRITNVVGTVGGNNVSGNYTITATGVDYVEFTHPSGAASSSQTNTSDFTVDFIEGAFVESLVGGVTLHAAIKAFPASPYAGTDLWYVHSFVEDPTDSSGAFFIGVTGGSTGPRIAKVTGMITGSRTLSKLTQIDASSGRGEPTIKRLANGNLVGFLRSNSSTSTGGFFYSTDGGDTWTNRLNVPAFNDFRSSPMPLDVDLDTNRIYAVATGNRIGGESGTAQATDVPLYLIEGDAANAIVNGWTAFTITQIGSLYFANESQGDSGNGVGVGSVVINRGVLHIFEATENAENVGAVFGAPDILHIKLNISDDDGDRVQNTYSVKLPSATHSGAPDVAYAGIFRGLGAAHILGAVNSNGTKNWGDGFTVSTSGTGIYDVVITNPLPTAQYHVTVLSDGNGNAVGSVSAAKTVNGFQIAMRNVASAGALTNAAFTFNVFVNYQFTRTDWQGSF